MTRQPIYRTSERVKALRAQKFRVFKHRYPSPFYAWVERQRFQSVRRFWAATMDPYTLPELKVLLAVGHEPVTSQELWDCWFRAAVTMLVHPLRGREQGDFTARELALAFGISLTRYQALVEKEKKWRKPDPKPVVRPGLMAGQPDIEDLYIHLIK